MRHRGTAGRWSGKEIYRSAIETMALGLFQGEDGLHLGARYGPLSPCGPAR